jgi:hypothetical protein
VANKTVEELAREELERRQGGTGPTAPKPGTVEEQAQTELAVREVEERIREEMAEEDPNLIEEAVANVVVFVKEFLDNDSIPSEVKTGVAAAAGVSLPSVIRFVARAAGKLASVTRIGHPAVAIASTAASIGASTSVRLPNESSEDYRARLRYGMEDSDYSSPYPFEEPRDAEPTQDMAEYIKSLVPDREGLKKAIENLERGEN